MSLRNCGLLLTGVLGLGTSAFGQTPAPGFKVAKLGDDRHAEHHTFFEGHERFPFRDGQGLDWQRTWWLSEAAFLVYMEDSRRIGPIAQAVGFEHAFISHNETEVLLLWDAERVIVAFRGSDSRRDWQRNICIGLAPFPGGGQVHSGFLSALDEVWRPLAARLDGLLARQRLGRPRAPGRVRALYFTGHSLGGALAVLAAARRGEGEVVTFGAPRIGDAAFAERVGARVIHVVNDKDSIVHMPSCSETSGYVDVGSFVRFDVDGNPSPWQRPALDPEPAEAGPRSIADHWANRYAALCWNHLREGGQAPSGQALTLTGQARVARPAEGPPVLRLESDRGRFTLVDPPEALLALDCHRLTVKGTVRRSFAWGGALAQPELVEDHGPAAVVARDPLPPSEAEHAGPGLVEALGRLGGGE